MQGTRREMIQGMAALSGGIITGLHSAAQASTTKGLVYKGIAYDTGTNYLAGPLSRPVWSGKAITRDLTAIRDDLRANSVSFFGTDLARLKEGAEAASALGLAVWLQPRLMEASQKAVIEHLAETARIAEALRAAGAKITLNLGCELTLFTAGLLPGATMFERMQALIKLSPDGFRRLSATLNDHLDRSRAAIDFAGPITYAAGPWEDIDWRKFDLVGLDYYRDAENSASYVSGLRRFRRFGKPIVITEFGSCAFKGAENMGGNGWSIVDYESGSEPVLKKLYERSEQVQADVITSLLDLYQAEDITGAFVYQFIDVTAPHSPDPRRDLDMASYGIVKVTPEQTDGAQWTPKLAFRAIAEAYGKG